jgi:LAO/AO transport system kinase
VALMLAGAGDELQGIKKGLLELADLVAVNKADGEGFARACAAAAEYRAALQILTPPSAAWSPPVLTASGLTGQGLDTLWGTIVAHRQSLEAAGELVPRRRAQDAKWMWALVHERMHQRLAGDGATRERVQMVERAVAEGKASPTTAAESIVTLLGL